MSALKPLTSAIVVIVLLSSVAPTASASAAGTGSSTNAYAGTHVSFETETNAVTGYAVDGEAMLSSVKVQSADSTESGGIVDVGTSLSAVSSLEGAGLTLSSKTETSATVDVEGSASMDAHDNEHGVLVVRAGSEEQYVQANLSDEAEARSTGDGRVEVTTADGVEGTFIVRGGEVTVNDEGDITAQLGKDSQLVFRAYQNGKSDEDAEQERLIADGKAAGEVHVMSRNGETVTDTVAYGRDTAVEAQQSGEGQVEVTVDRAAHEGKVFITTVSEEALDATDGLSVTVDGEVAAEASSYSELEGAIGSDQSKYLVRQSSSAEGSAQVLVAVNHFSERTVTMSGSDGDGSNDGSADDADGSGTDDDGSNGPTSSPGQPGFGVLVALVALIAAVLLAHHRG